MRPLFSNTMLGLALAACGAAGAASAAEAGRIVFVAGEVQLAGRAAVLDAAVQEGDELRTGAQGYVYMKTVDSGFLILRPNSKARITTYHVDAANPANTRVKLELLGGVARSISGQAVKQARQNFRFNTPVAAIGVRGTDFTVFTDQQTSRIAVVSGGVVVSGFTGACGPAGGGPCEGSASRELFAGQPGMLLQVQRGQNAPKLMHNPALSPDQGAPPRGDEPVSKAPLLPALDLSLEAHKNNVLNNPPKVAAETTTPPPAVAPVTPVGPIVPVNPVIPVTPVVPETPVLVKAPDVLWGRYDAIAAAPANEQVKAQIKSGIYTQGARIGAYQISQLKDTSLVMPNEGTASFTLAASEATLQKDGQAPALAQVQDAKLSVDFGARTFSTGMTLVNSGVRAAISGNGNIHSDGALQSGGSSNMNIKGYLGGGRAQEAAYIFKADILPSGSTPALTAEGGTSWTR